MKKDDQDDLNSYYLRGLELTGYAHQRGISILAGTDTYDPYSFPGFSLHTELEQLTKAGLSNAEALASATILPATYFGTQHLMGSVDVGKKADLILLKRNPLEDISHTQDIEIVIFDGAVYDEEDIRSQKEYVEKNVSGLSGISLTIKMIVAMFRDNNPEARNAGY
nr:amidohydrolase family protein [Alteromonas ponticola]